MKQLQFLIVMLLSFTLLATVGNAAKRRKSDDGPHPIKILKVVQDGSSRDKMSGSSGKYHVWMQNTTDVAVDKVQVELELYNGSGRLVDTFKKEMGELDAGQKKMAEIRYDIIGERNLRPRVWIMYNAGKEQPAQFEASGAHANW